MNDHLFGFCKEWNIANFISFLLDSCSSALTFKIKFDTKSGVLNFLLLKFILLSDFILDISMAAVVDDHYSSFKPIISDVPQGFLLS